MGIKVESQNIKISANQLRSLFTVEISSMYQQEVPQYAKLRSLVNTVNNKVLTNEVRTKNPSLLTEDEKKQLSVERHGAIRLGTAAELSTMRRLFAVMGMFPVDYYDLSAAGIPVHSTAFRPIDQESMKENPFRIFTSLLRLDLIDELLKGQVAKILASRNIFSAELFALITISEKNDGLNQGQAEQFIREVLNTFCWHKNALVEKNIYDLLKQYHPLIADVVSFKGPHINHLTPPTLDIDQLQKQLQKQNFKAKKIVEGPPRRAIPILLRQTSFLAIEEPVTFLKNEKGMHTARFGEIEQRGVALTEKGRGLYDHLLKNAKTGSESDYLANLKKAFLQFPDTHKELRQQGLAYYQYRLNKNNKPNTSQGLEELIENNHVIAQPIIYEDFLPVSAAGIFQSNLRLSNQKIQQKANQQQFEEDLGAEVFDSFSLYKEIEQQSLKMLVNDLTVIGITIT